VIESPAHAHRVDCNIARRAVDRHVHEGRGDRVALRTAHFDDEVRDMSYAELLRCSEALAGSLRELGVGAGERVFSLLPAGPEVVVTALAAWRLEAVHCALFAGYGPDMVGYRLAAARARALVTDGAGWRLVRDAGLSLPGLVIVTGDAAEAAAGVHRFADLTVGGTSANRIGHTGPETSSSLFFTSGTTGPPKAAMHVHGALDQQVDSARQALGLGAGDRYWCSADPGWVTGIVYGVSAPLAIGACSLVVAGGFDPERWCRLLSDHRINVWYTSPTALRFLRRLPPQTYRAHDWTELRVIASVGEPLDAETTRWAATTFDTEVRDTWWQTETGAILIANRGGRADKYGAMGLPLDGVEAALVERTGAGACRVVEDGAEGELAIRKPWPAMIAGYLDEPDRYRAAFAGDWYLSGDRVRRDEEGWFWYLGRLDDAIKSAGHLIGPFEVERALLDHPAVADVGVAGVSDPVTGHDIVAFVVGAGTGQGSDELARELIAHARRHLGPAAAPRRIRFVASLPRTHSGKILRRKLPELVDSDSPTGTSS
jgi:acetyl-CoA synthetase